MAVVWGRDSGAVEADRMRSQVLLCAAFISADSRRTSNSASSSVQNLRSTGVRLLNSNNSLSHIAFASPAYFHLLLTSILLHLLDDEATVALEYAERLVKLVKPSEVRGQAARACLVQCEGAQHLHGLDRADSLASALSLNAARGKATPSVSIASVFTCAVSYQPEEIQSRGHRTRTPSHFRVWCQGVGAHKRGERIESRSRSRTSRRPRRTPRRGRGAR